MKKISLKKLLYSVTALIATVCLATSSLVAMPLTASAETLTLATDLVKVSSATATTEKSHVGTVAGRNFSGGALTKVGSAYLDITKKTVTGLTVESETAYSGTFDGVFTGSTTLKFKFPGVADPTMQSTTNYQFKYNNELMAISDEAGDFYFTVTSVATGFSFTYRISRASYTSTTGYVVHAIEFKNGNTTLWAGLEGNSSTNVKLQGANPFSNNKLVETYYAFNTNNGIEQFSKNADTNFFLTLTDSSGYLTAKYNRTAGNNGIGNSGKSIDHYTGTLPFDGTTTMGSTGVATNLKVPPKFDTSQGYTISFGSDWATGTDVCFTSITGTYTANPTVSYGAKFVGLDGAELDATYAAGETVTLPEGTNYNGETFIGWDIGGKLYPAGYSWTVPADLTEDMTVNAVGVTFGIVDGASVRNVSNENGNGGLRFMGNISSSDIADNVAFGMYLNGVQVSATNTLSATSASKLMKDKYVDTNTYFTAVITDLEDSNYTTDVTAETYISVTYADSSTKVFKSSSVIRNAKQVAEKALEVGETGDMLYEYAGVEKPTMDEEEA